ncbi:MAG TPA: glutathione S-transferase family protein [Ferrovibrio sp.]|jgi:glutathione S-transferase|uniref:glutathione S-transferase family protein n=1 Tax=Ferrovibrio sp. TaxID=1917215 RepID=UPI002B4B885F|nr:glutathione S-transferase family protein [Ferrovibrio sp.]HLT77778.1 glutathione S-transferase family protein [Ferrovibrio sp.]
MPAACTLYGSFLSAPTYRVGLMLALCGLPFDYRHVDLSKGEHKTAEFLELNRFGQVPVLVHDGLNLCQSFAILEYLAEVTGKFAPATMEERQRIREWLFWDADRLSPGIGRTRFFERFAKPDAAVMDYMRMNAEAGLGVLNAQLEGKRFLVGERPTIADIGCFGTLIHMAEGRFELANWPNVKTWWDRMSALPGFTPPYDLLPKFDRAAA